MDKGVEKKVSLRMFSLNVTVKSGIVVDFRGDTVTFFNTDENP